MLCVPSPVSLVHNREGDATRYGGIFRRVEDAVGELPEHVKSTVPEGQRLAEDSLFWMSAFHFPEAREPLWPQRQFPLTPRSELPDDAVIEVQTMGLQYCVHAQVRRDPTLEVTCPSSWDRSQFLWTDLPVFAEEPCEWHYPKLQVGYNVGRIEPPAMLRPEANTPQRYGYLPNGDILMHWSLAEPLADELDLDIEGIPSTVDDHILISVQGVGEQALIDAPVGQGSEVGIVLSRKEKGLLTTALNYIEAIGGTATVYEPGTTSMFFRLLAPVIHCEWELNPYLEAAWESLDLSVPRLAAWDFRIVDNPASRNEPIFATEKGNVVVSADFYEMLRGLLGKMNGPPPGRALPIIRTP